MHVVRFGEFHHQRDRRAEHRNLAGQQEVIDERGPVHHDGGGEDVRHVGLHPSEHGGREDFEPLGIEMSVNLRIYAASELNNSVESSVVAWSMLSPLDGISTK